MLRFLCYQLLYFQIQALQLQQEKDKRGLSSRHWKDEWTLVQEQHAALLTWQLNTVEQSLKLNLRTLETLYQKYKCFTFASTTSNVKIVCGLQRNQFSNENERKSKKSRMGKIAEDSS